MKRLTLLLLCLTFLSSLAAQTSVNTAQLTAKEAAKKDSLKDALAYLKKQVPSLTVAAEKRAGYAFMGSVQEQMGLYADAQKSYVAAAGIAAGDAFPAQIQLAHVLQTLHALSCSNTGQHNTVFRNTGQERLIVLLANRFDIGA